jgi:RNA-binding protein
MRAMNLTEKQLRFLRGKAHALKPVVMLGQKGLTDNVVAEAVEALRVHELIKVKVRAADRATRDSLLAELVARSGSSLVNRIGHVATLYRPGEPLARLVLPAP